MQVEELLKVEQEIIDSVLKIEMRLVMEEPVTEEEVAALEKQTNDVLQLTVSVQGGEFTFEELETHVKQLGSLIKGLKENKSSIEFIRETMRKSQ